MYLYNKLIFLVHVHVRVIFVKYSSVIDVAKSVF